MLTVLDFRDLGERAVYRAPRRIIQANDAQDVPAAMGAIAGALEEGLHVAGWFSYELGYALEPRLERLCPNDPVIPLLKVGAYSPPQADTDLQSGSWTIGPLIPEWPPDQYKAAFARVHEYIFAGDIYQANLSFRAHFQYAGDPFGLYEALRAQAAAPYCAFIDDGTRQIASLSPELFFDLRSGGHIETRPMKGTMPRAGDDETARRALASSTKDRAENLMIVDLIRNDLGRVAEIGSVRVPELFSVETYPTLHAMTSSVTAQLRKNAGPAEIIKALFPCGSVTGTPKIRAMEILHQLEISRRGAYCGAIGTFRPEGSAVLNVGIRTITFTNGRAELGIGGGVVADSTEEREYEECLLKAQFLLQGAGQRLIR